MYSTTARLQKSPDTCMATDNIATTTPTSKIHNATNNFSIDKIKESNESYGTGDSIPYPNT